MPKPLSSTYPSPSVTSSLVLELIDWRAMTSASQCKSSAITCALVFIPLGNTSTLNLARRNRPRPNTSSTDKTTHSQCHGDRNRQLQKLHVIVLPFFHFFVHSSSFLYNISLLDIHLYFSSFAAVDVLTEADDL